jgi:ribokinase
MTRLAVIGHVEWVNFLAVEQLPAQGQITPAKRIRENAGGGAVVAATVMATLCDEVEFFAAFGEDQHAERAIAELRSRGIIVHAATRPLPSREVITFIDARGERSITTIGARLQPALSDPLPWERLQEIDGVYFTAGDHGALLAARAAGKLVVTPRICEALGAVTVDLDAVVYSADDQAERLWASELRDHAVLEVVTEGEHGGHWSGESSGRWQAVQPAAPVVDSYGAGDSFAAGFTYGVASGKCVAQAAQIAAACGAQALTHPGGP